MVKVLHLLVIAEDEGLFREIEDALRPITEVSFIVHRALGYSRGGDEARHRQPDIVCVEMPRDVDRIRTIAGEIHAGAPHALLLGIIEEAAFESSEAEADYLLRALRSQVRDFLRRPVSTAEFTEQLKRHRTGFEGGQARAGTVACFTSNKGGVGKSTLAVNSAVLLARRRPERTLLVDASLQFGVCDALLDLDPQSTIADAAQEIGRLDPTLLRELAAKHASGVHLLAAPRNPLQSAEVTDETLSGILSVARLAYDYVVVDTFPVLDAHTIAVLDRSDRCFVTFNPSLPVIVGAERYLAVLDKLGVARDQQRLVLNNCHPRHLAALKPTEVATRLDRAIDHVIPFSKSLLVAANTGEPEMLNSRGRFGFGLGLGRAFKRLADDVAGNEPAAAVSEPADLDPAPQHPSGDADEHSRSEHNFG